jgi:SRSO17 transposase
VTALARRLAPACARAPSRDRVLAERRGVRCAAERKHSGQVADVCGEPTPDGCQDGLRRADGEAHAVRDARRTSSRHHLGASNGGWGLDATGLRQKGRPAAGGARPYPGPVGTGEHGPMGGVMGDASRRGHAWVDRAREGPAAWAQNRERCRPAGIPGDQPLATQPQLACQLWARAGAAGSPGAVGDRRPRVRG